MRSKTTSRRTSMRIETLWREVGQSKELPAFRRINETHPLDIYLGVDAETRRVLLLVSNQAFEIKSVSTGKTRVQIASLRQLDFLSGPLNLLVVPMNPASTGTGVS